MERQALGSSLHPRSSRPSPPSRSRSRSRSSPLQPPITIEQQPGSRIRERRPSAPRRSVIVQPDHGSRLPRDRSRSPSHQPTMVVTPQSSRVRERYRSRSPTQPTVVIQQPYLGSRARERHSRSRSPTTQPPLIQPYSGSRIHQSQRPRSPSQPPIIVQQPDYRQRTYERHSSPPPVVVIQPPYRGSQGHDHRHSRTPQPPVVVTQPDYDFRSHDRHHSSSPRQHTIVIQPPYPGSRRHERRRSRSPQPAIIVQQQDYSSQAHDRHRPPSPQSTVMTQPPYHSSRGNERRRSRSPPSPVIVQQHYYGSQTHDRHRPPSPQPTVLMQPPYERRRSRSPQPIVIAQQPYYGSRRRHRSRSPPPIVTVPQPYPGLGGYERQDSRSRSPPQPIIIPQHYSGARTHEPLYSQSGSVHRRSSSHRNRSSQSYARPQVIILPNTTRSASSSPAPTIIPPDASYSGGSRSMGQNDTVFTAVDPFRPSVGTGVNFATQTPYYYDSGPQHLPGPPHLPSYSYGAYPVPRRTAWKTLLLDGLKLIWTFLFDTLPRRCYLYFLLRLPAFYFSRVARIFEEADMTMSEIKGMALATLVPMDPNAAVPDWDHTIPALNSKLKLTWEGFIDSLLREWKTLNLVSVLLLSAIVTILQIQDAANDPIARNAALLSLICALMSLLYGCMYIIRFGSMRKTYKAAEWATEAQKSKTLIWWNVWVLLAMPAIWLAWSIVLYIVCIMTFVWRSGTSDGSTSMLSQHDALGPRIAISTVLGLGTVYLVLILNTFRQYGDAMDKAWSKRVTGWAREQLAREKRYHGHSRRSSSSGGRSLSPRASRHSYSSYSQVPTRAPSSTQYPSQFNAGYPGQSIPGQYYPASSDPVYNYANYPAVVTIPPVTQYPTSAQDSNSQGYDPAPFVPPIYVPPPTVIVGPPLSVPSVGRHRSRSYSRIRPRSVSRVQRPHEFSSPSSLVSSPIDEGNPISNYNPPILIPAPGQSTIIVPATNSNVPFETLKVMDLRFMSRAGNLMPDVLYGRDIHVHDWTKFISEASNEFTGDISLCQWNNGFSEEVLRPQDVVAEVVDKWNNEFFYPRGTSALLCYEYLAGSTPAGFAIYLVDWLSRGSQPLGLEERFESILQGLERIDIYNPPPTETSRMRAFRRAAMFTKRPRARGRVSVGVSLTKQNVERRARAATRLTTITEMTERSSRPSTGAGIPISGSPEMRPQPQRSRSSTRSTRRSRWSRSPSYNGRLNGGEAPAIERHEYPTPSPPPRPLPSPIVPNSSPRRSPYAEITQWPGGVQLQVMDSTEGLQPIHQPVIYLEPRPTSSRDTSSAGRQLSRNSDDRPWRNRGYPQVRTDPRVSPNDTSSSQRHSNNHPSRYDYRHRSAPVGYAARLPTDPSFRRSPASVATHYSDALSYTPVPHEEQEYRILDDGMGGPSRSVGPFTRSQSITSESRNSDRDDGIGSRMPYPPLLSPLPIRRISLEFEGYAEGDTHGDEQWSPEEQDQFSSENRLGPAGLIEGPWKRDMESLQSILGNQWTQA